MIRNWALKGGNFHLDMREWGHPEGAGYIQAELWGLHDQLWREGISADYKDACIPMFSYIGDDGLPAYRPPATRGLTCEEVVARADYLVRARYVAGLQVYIWHQHELWEWGAGYK